MTFWLLVCTLCTLCTLCAFASNVNASNANNNSEFTGYVKLLVADNLNGTDNNGGDLSNDYFVLLDSENYNFQGFLNFDSTYDNIDLNKNMIVHGEKKGDQIFVQNITKSENNYKQTTPLSGKPSLGVFFIQFSKRLCGFDTSECSTQITLDKVHDMFYRNTDQNIKDFFYEISDGELNFQVNASSIHQTILDENPTNFYDSLDTLVKSAIGIDTGNYDYQVFIFPTNWYVLHPFSKIYPAQTVGIGETPGRKSWTNSKKMDVILHELGHNFGFGHSNARSSQNNIIEYGDRSSVMSRAINKPKRGINSIHKMSVGWIDDTDVIDLMEGEGGEWQLSPLNGVNNSTNIKIITLRASPENATTLGIIYYIEFRKKISYDSQLEYSQKDTIPQGPLHDVLLIRHLDSLEKTKKTTVLDAILEIGQVWRIPGDQRSIVHFAKDFSKDFAKDFQNKGNVLIEIENKDAVCYKPFPPMPSFNATLHTFTANTNQGTNFHPLDCTDINRNTNSSLFKQVLFQWTTPETGIYSINVDDPNFIVKLGRDSCNSAAIRCNFQNLTIASNVNEKYIIFVYFQTNNGNNGNNNNDENKIFSVTLKRIDLLSLENANQNIRSLRGALVLSIILYIVLTLLFGSILAAALFCKKKNKKKPFQTIL